MMPTDDTAILDQLLDPFAATFSSDAAKAIVGFRADAKTQAFVDRLAEKANEGTLTDDERRQYEKLVDAANVIAILQVKARKALSQKAG